MNEFENNNQNDNNINYQNTQQGFQQNIQNEQQGDYGYRVYNSQGADIQNVSENIPQNVGNGNFYQNNNENIQYFNQQQGVEANRDFIENDNLNKNQRQSSIQFVTMNSKKRKNRKFVRKAAAVCAVAVVFGGSLGFGAVMGTKTSENIISDSGYVDFKFQDIPQVDQVSVSDNNEIINIVKNASNSVVNISIKVQQRDFFNQAYESTGSGSGIIYKADNDKIYIVTNNHVIEDAVNVNISITGNEQISAKLVGKDAQSDVAVISVLKTDLAAANITDYKVAEFADSDKVEVGEYVLAIGNALGQGKTVTQGIISAQNKEVNIDGKKLTVLQTDATINPGNSGGALVNSTGKIIGMNTAKLSGTGVEGTGYALPSTSVKSIADELIVNGTVAKPYLGISGFTMSDDFIRMYNINSKGVFIKSVEKGSAAEAAGIKYSDIITAINGTQISTMEELSSIISKCKVGDKINISIIRNGYEPMSITATLADMNSKF